MFTLRYQHALTSFSQKKQHCRLPNPADNHHDHSSTHPHKPSHQPHQSHHIPFHPQPKRDQMEPFPPRTPLTLSYAGRIARQRHFTKLPSILYLRSAPLPSPPLHFPSKKHDLTHLPASQSSTRGRNDRNSTLTDGHVRNQRGHCHLDLLPRRDR